MQVRQLSQDICSVESFLSPDECLMWITRGKEIGFREAEVAFETGAQLFKGIRDNERVELHDEALAQQLFQKVEPFLWDVEDLKPCGCVPHIRIYRYRDGQRFKAHRDGSKEWQGKHSRITFMVYLNDNYAGGETLFEEIKITPRTGMALLFNHGLKHEAKPVLEGCKYVLRLDILYA